MPKRSTLRLTRRFVAKLKPAGKDEIFWDGELAGFGVRVHATGRKVFIIQSRGPSGLKRVTLGPVGGGTIEKYRRDAAVVIDRIKRGEDPRPAEPAPEPTVADLAARCVSARFGVRCKPATAKHYKMALDRHVLPMLGTMPLSEVGPKEAAALHHRMRDMPAMVNRAVWVLSRLFVMAEIWEMAPPGRNPCRYVGYYREKSRERFLTPEEFRRLGAALRRYEARGTTQASAVAALRLLMLTGCRMGEILSLRWDDVDRTSRVLRLRDGKTGPRMVSLTGPVLAVLEGIERVEDVRWVIRSKSDRRLTGLFYYWQHIRRDAGLEDVRVHDLRHSYASRALALGESLAVIGGLLGHSKVETTAKYAHLVRDAEKAAAARTGDSIGAQLMPAGAKAA